MITGIMEELKPQREVWKSETRAIMAKYMTAEELEQCKGGKGKHGGKGKGSCEGKTKGQTQGKSLEGKKMERLLFSGDTLFPGGAGATKFPGGNFKQIMTSIEDRFYKVLSDDHLVLPGHGDDTTIGTEKPHFDEWVARGW